MFSYTQNIYTAAELTAAGVPAGAVITAIEFSNGTGESLVLHNCRTYMAHRPTTSFTSASDYTPYNQLTLVDSSDWVTTGSGWFLVNLATPYVWDGTGNLLVAVSYGGASLNGTNIGYNYTAQSESRHWRRGCRLNGGPADAVYASYPEYTATSTPSGTAFTTQPAVSTYRPNLRISYILSNCPSFTPSVANIGPYSADLNWGNYNQSALSFDLVYGEASTFDTLTSTTITGLTDTFYALTGLTSATAYKACIKSHCSSESGSWSAPRTFTTLAACPTPTQLTVGTVTADQVTVSWYPGATETSWELVCVPHGSPVTSGTSEYPTSYPYTVYNLNDDTQYDIYVRANCGNGEWSYWTFPVTFTTDPLCTPPANVTVSQIMGTSALVSWNSALVGADSYTVEYSEHNLNNWVPATVSVTSYMLSGLTPETSYDVRVFSNCQLGDADTVNVTFLTECLSMSKVALEDGTANSSYIPVSNSNAYSYSQQIYLASELNNTPMDIKRIAFEYTYSVSMTAKNNVDIYLGHTTQSSFVTNTSWVTYSNLQKVYSGSLNCRKGWNTFVLDTTFHYNGVDNLVLVVDDNSGSSNGSTSYTFAYKSQSPNYMTMYYYNASNNPNPQSPPTATSRNYNRNNVRFMSECDLTATCIAPNAYVSDITASSITVDWVPGNNENSWQMEYSTNGITWTSEGSVTYPYTLTNLTSDMDYFIRLRSNCGGGDFSPWTILQAHTPCMSVTLPYTENFETAPASGSGNMVSCWTTLSNYTSTHYPYTSSSQHHSGTYSVYFYGTTAYYSYLISPRLDDAVQMNNVEVSFWAYKGSANYYIQVGVMTDPSDPNTFVQIGQNISPSTTSTWQYFDINTSLYTGQGQYIAFRIPQEITNYMYIDDINIHNIPSCPHVQNIHTVTNTVTSNSADIAWTPGGMESEWIVVYGLEGTISDPDQGLATATTVYTPSISLTNLSGGAAYDVYVKAICSGADSSQWYQSNFRTECGTITLPFSEGFESFATGSTNAIPCWTRNSTYNTSYPYVTTTAATGSHGLYFYGTSANYSCIAMPPVDPTVNVNTLQVECDFRSSSTTAYKMIVGVMTNPASISTFSPVETLAVSSTGVFQHFEVPLSSYTGTGSYIAFKSVTTGTSSAASYLDNVYISVIPTCRRPLDVTVSATTTNSATINWTPRNGETDWQVVVVPHGQSVTSGTPEYAMSHPYTVQGLTDATNYDVYVKADCGNGDESDWSEVVTFHTKCLPISTIPYFESFEGVGSGSNAFPTCWSKKSDYTTDPYVSTSYHSQGSASLYFYATSACYMYAASQALDLSNYAPGDLAISYKLMPYSGMLYARMDVGIMTDPDDPATFTCLRSHYADDFTALNTWHSFSIPLNQTYSTPVYVTFFAPVSYSTKYMYVDEVKVDYAPTCSAPTNLTFSNIAGASVLVSWLDSQYGDGDYTVEYSSDNVTWSTEIVTGTSLQLSGLTPNTTYYVHVYRNCMSGNSSILSGSFSTGCLSGGDVAVGNGTTTTYSLPVNNYYNYCFTQQIYLASEMGGERDITSLSFDYAYTTSMTAKNNVSIYLGNTTQSTFSSTTNYVPITNQQLVYTGPLNCHQGWNTFNLTTPFHYNGTSNLVITIDDNSNNKNTSSHTFHYHPAGATRSLYYYSDDNNPDPSNPTGVSTSKTTTGNRSNIIFGSPCDTLTTCIPPTAYISARDHESLTVTWAPGNTESAWEFEYKAANDASWTQVPGATSPTVLSNLTANTVYNIRLRSDCGSGDYSDWKTLVGETECDPITVPYMQNFDSTTAATGAMVPCWTRGTNNSTAYPYLSTSYSESTPNAVYFYSTTMYYAYLASPRFDDATVMDSLLIRFKARKTSTSYPYFIEVGIMTDPNDYNTFTAVGSFAPSSSTLEFENAEIRTDSYTGNGKYVAFRSPRITNYMYLDDVQIDYIPNCLHAENVHAVASTVTPYAADVIWTPGGDETEWNVVYGPAGSITDPSQETPQTVYGTPSISLSNLTANTLYEVFVQGLCSNGESSLWEVGTFRTACAAISTLPYSENFDTYAGATTTSVSVNNLPACWDNFNQGSSTSYSGYPIIYNSSTNANSGSNAMRFYTYTTLGSYDDQVAILPPVDITTIPLNTLMLSFNARENTTSYTFKLEVGVMTNPSDINSFVPIDTVEFTSTTYAHYSVTFEQYTGTGRYIAIKAPQPTTGYNYGYVDDVVLDVAPSCAAPTNFHISAYTSSSADLSWTDGVGESSWEVLVIPANQNPDYTQAQPVTGSATYTESNLLPNTAYKAYLRTVCSNGLGYSEWVSISFVLPSANPAPVPYFHDFDDGTENAEWVLLNSTRPNKWYIGVPTGMTDSILYISNDNGQTNAYTVASENTTVWAYRDIQFGPGAEFELKFNWRCYGEGSYDFLKVYLGNPVMVEAKTTSTLYNTTTDDPAGTLVLEPKFNLESNWTTYTAALPGSVANSVQRLYFRWTNDASAGTQPPAAVDSIMITVSNCGRPSNVVASTVSSTTADITFTPALSTDNSWEYVYTTSATADPDQLTPNTTQSTTISLSGLSASTTYYLYVRTNCGGGDFSHWSQVLSFNTACGAITIPYSENFDNMGSGSSIIPNCWGRLNDYSTTTNYPYVNTSYHTSGNAGLYFYCSTSTYNIAVLPIVDVTTNPINTLQLSFQMRSTSAITSTLTVGVMTNPLDASTFTPVTALHNTVTATFEPQEVPLSSYTGQGAYVALKLTNTGGTYSVYIDDIMLETIPTCPRPSNVAVTSSTQTSVTLSWTENGSAPNWNVQYGPAGFTLGTGTTVQVQTTPTTTITGLSASTTYDFYVQSDCGGGDVSSWSNKGTGATQCAAITQLPYTENFDSYGTGTTAYPNCWSKINTYSSERPYCNSSYAYGGSTAGLYFYATGTMYNIATTPEFDATIPINTLKAKFMFRGGSSSTNYVNAMQVGVMTNPMDASTFVPVDTVYAGSSVTTYESREVSFANYTGTGHFIAFKNGLLGGGTYYYAGMDNLVISVDSNATPPTPPTCATPTGLAVAANTITQTTATATWNAGGTETAWDLQYKLHSASDWGNTIPLTARNYNFTGLTAGTQYDVRVRANCGNNDVSAWTSAVSFTTATQGQDPCNDPTGLTASGVNTTSAVLDWTENGAATSWTINYQETGVAQWSTATANEHPYTLTGLQPATSYQAYVVANCDDGMSGASNMVTFTTLGVGINDYEQTFSLYPNPNNGRFTVISEQGTVNRVQIYDVYGKLLKTVEVNANTAELDVRDLASGMYFVRINTEKGVVTKSFVKK